MKTSTSTNPAIRQPSVTLDPRCAASGCINLARGARLFGIHPQEVCVDSEVLDDYAEPDATLGQNIAGVILSVLACHIAVNPGGFRGRPILVCLLRREDARLVEVELQVHRLCHRQDESLQLRQTGERILDVQFD